MKASDYNYWSSESLYYNAPEKRTQERKMVTKRYSGVSLFCESTSIRGMAKIAKSQTRFLKVLWLLFIVFMSGGLFASATLLVLDFLNYDVGVHTSNLEISSEFPALTVCHHHPFSNNAYRLWEEGRILSPTKFNQQLRQLGKASLLSNDLNLAMFAMFYDSRELYYQSLPYDDVVELGHNVTAFRNCMINLNGEQVYEDDCEELKQYTVKRLSDNNFFNCYTFEPKSKEIAEGTTLFAVVVSLGPSPNYTHFEQAFMNDIFEQAHGLRVVVHERGSLPNIRKDGLHVEPGKFTEISYQPVLWKKLDTPRKPCKNINDTLRDLGRDYIYEAEQCDRFHDQQIIQNECKCILAKYIRPSFPKETLPYCGIITTRPDKFKENIDCLRNVFGTKLKKRNTEPDENGALCLPRCRFPEFQNQISITKWRVTDWQLHWMRYQYRLLKSLEQSFKESNETLNLSTTEQYKKLLKYFDAENLTQFNGNINNFLSGAGEENFAYVLLKRKSNVVVYKREKLILTLNVLLSRIGGLCSLSIGLTTAFVVEIIEFLYLYFQAASNYVPEVKIPKPTTSGKKFINRTDEFSMFERSRAPLEVYGTNNGRLDSQTRDRLFQPDFRTPMSSRMKLRKDGSTSAFIE